ncbi:MAG: OmpH family outer membrane protein [Jannaschia helgolandensis]|jgi:Skp family chaperone for outer membrane proteins|uniref:OmpH family outer membrane protein n=1 Tax=Jannaschia helgolandensis TaxID=188906 RepID=UPI0030DB72CA|tara:strand:- start:1323 stop:1937 length:615 start_codon:yes stop_codon:yes gene_type:complete
MRRAGLLLATIVACATGSGSAQQAVDPPQAVGVPQSAVVVLDRDTLFSNSLFGRRVARDIETASTELAAENRRIEAELEAEERALTIRRDEMDVVAFRTLADDFDSRVTGIRQAQDAKARAITQQTERAQQIFFERANPVLVDLARETGALVILDRRIVIASADQVDITALAQTRIDAMLGDGSGLLDRTIPEPRPTPGAAPGK